MKDSDKQKSNPNEDLEGFEIELEERFAPIRPDPQFVDRLRRRLTYPSETELEIPNRIVNLGMTVVILVVGLLLTVGMARFIYDFLALVGIIHPDQD
jgi:hypothetical protein